MLYNESIYFQSPYAQLLAATTLTKLVTRPNLTLPLEQRIDIRKDRCWYMNADIRFFKLFDDLNFTNATKPY